MTRKFTKAAAVAAGLMLWAPAAHAHECPALIARATAMIDLAQTDIMSMANDMLTTGDVEFTTAQLAAARELVAQAEEAHRTAGSVPHNHGVAMIYAFQAYSSAEALHRYMFTHIMKHD